MEFKLEDDISPQEAIQLLAKRQTQSDNTTTQTNYDNGETVQTLKVYSENDNENGNEDPFATTLLRTDIAELTPIVVNREMLTRMQSSEVMIVEWPNDVLPKQFYKNVMCDIHITKCSMCNKVSDDKLMWM